MNSISLDVNHVAGQAQKVTVFDVQYLHVELQNEGDLYVTEYGLPFIRNLYPENFWTDKEWFAGNSSKLFGHAHPSGGSGTIYRVRTKPVNGRSKDIVMKWNRMAQDVPGHRDHDELLTAEFNSPFEEFALLMEMREAWRDLDAARILTHKPLAIYVPAEKVEPWRIGRKEYRMQDIIRDHPEVELDLYRRYAVIYEWVKGIDLQEACRGNIVSEDEMAKLTLAVDQDLSRLGFAVRDRKPQHIIVRVDDDKSLVESDRRLSYALVDFELLERTPEREELVKAGQRQQYLRRQAHRFEISEQADTPSHLCPLRIMDVNYVFGVAESTGGRLWIVGKDPMLFDYFLPERWEHTPRTRLSAADEVYETVTKDNIHVVWKSSHVGEHPDVDPFKPEERRILEHGYNSPFEEISLALELQSKGVLTTMPRAIYETHHLSTKTTVFGDQSRYNSHDDLRIQNGKPILRHDRDYIVIWGYWNKPDESLAEDDRDYYQPVDALHALHSGVLNNNEYMALMQTTKERLQRIGIEDLSFSGHHKLLSLDASGSLVKDGTGMPEVRICNFELMKRT